MHVAAECSLANASCKVVEHRYDNFFPSERAATTQAQPFTDYLPLSLLLRHRLPFHSASNRKKLFNQQDIVQELLYRASLRQVSHSNVHNARHNWQ